MGLWLCSSPVRVWTLGCERNHMANLGNDGQWLKNMLHVQLVHPCLIKAQVAGVVRLSIKMPRLTNDQRNQAIWMLKSGINQERVARHFHVHQSTVSRLNNRYRATGRVSDCPHPGAQRVMSARQDRYIVISHLHNHFTTVEETARTTIGMRGRLINDWTIRCHLAVQRLRRRPYSGQILTHQHWLAQQWWAAAGGNLCGRRWANVIFSNESRFSVSFPDWCIRRQGHHFIQGCIIERDCFEGRGVVVWGAIVKWTLHAMLQSLLQLYSNIGQQYHKLWSAACV